MIKELSAAKKNAFKHSEWPLVLLKSPIEDPRFRIKALKIIKQLMQFMDIKHLLHVAEVVNSYFADCMALTSDKLALNYLRSLCSVGFKLNNLVPLDRHNFGLFC